MVDRIRLFDRYSKYSHCISQQSHLDLRHVWCPQLRRVVVCQDSDVASPSGNNNPRPEATTETMIAETEKPQKDLMKHCETVLEAEVEEWVISESCGRQC